MILFAFKLPQLGQPILTSLSRILVNLQFIYISKSYRVDIFVVVVFIFVANDLNELRQDIRIEMNEMRNTEYYNEEIARLRVVCMSLSSFIECCSYCCSATITMIDIV